MFLVEVKALLKKEILIEYKQRTAISSVLLYLVSTIFVCYLSFKQIIDIPTWNALFWIILLFTSLNAVSKSFLGGNRGLQLFYYSIASPTAVIISKIIYNVVLMLVVSMISLLFYSLFVGSTVLEEANIGLYLVSILLGAVGFASVFSMISAIASKTDNNIGLVAILGFPLILPFLLSVIALSKTALDGFGFEQGWSNILVLSALNLMVIALSFILFPYLWRE